MSSPSPAASVDLPELAVHLVLKSKRERLGLSMRELSRRAGLSESYVGALESGSLKLGFAAFARLAVELRLSAMEIYFLVQSCASEGRTETSS